MNILTNDGNIIASCYLDSGARHSIRRFDTWEEAKQGSEWNVTKFHRIVINDTLVKTYTLQQPFKVIKSKPITKEIVGTGEFLDLSEAVYGCNVLLPNEDMSHNYRIEQNGKVVNNEI